MCDTCGYAIDYARESDKKLNYIKVTQDVDRKTCHGKWSSHIRVYLATGTEDAVNQIIIGMLNKGSPRADLSIFANHMYTKLSKNNIVQ